MDIIRMAKDLANNSDHRYTTAATNSENRYTTAATDSSNNKSNILLTPLLKPSASASPVPGDTAKTPLVRPGHVAVVSRPPLVRPSSRAIEVTAVVKRVDGLTPLVTAGHVITVPSGEARMSVLKPPAAR
jgi:hypothetical protein